MKDFEYGRRKGYGWWRSVREENRIGVNSRSNWDVGEVYGFFWRVIGKENRVVRVRFEGFIIERDGEVESWEYGKGI